MKSVAVNKRKRAIDQGVAAFYRRFGFESSPLNPNQLLLLMKDLRATVKSVGFESGR